MKKIVLFDTSIASDNLGDEIIMEAVSDTIRSIYPGADFFNVPTHISLTWQNRKDVMESDIGFVGGTNLLGANWLLRPQWKIDMFDALMLPHPVLIGVGWKFYQRRTDLFTSFFLGKLLSKKFNHSVRDGYTEKRLRDIGIDNVINTACPTMWKLTPEHCKGISTKRARHVLTTVTAYRNNPEIDKKWLQILADNYEKIYFWPQMQSDEKYISEMKLGKKLEIIEPTFSAYNNALANLDVDFIGTRLHGGIRALQYKRRALIIEIDNRAAEIAIDTKLPTVKRDDLNGIKRWIEGSTPTVLSIPWDNIACWKSQFCA